MLIITRLSWRYRRGQKFFADDYWMAFSIVPLFLRVAFIHLALVNFTTYIRDPNYRKMGMGEEEIRKRILGSRMILPGRVFYAGFLWCMKICILIWFGRVTAGEKCYGTAIRFTYAFVAMSFVAVVLSTFLECRPVQLYWQVYPDPGQCVKAQYQLITMGVVNM